MVYLILGVYRLNRNIDYPHSVTTDYMILSTSQSLKELILGENAWELFNPVFLLDSQISSNLFVYL